MGSWLRQTLTGCPPAPEASGQKRFIALGCSEGALEGYPRTMKRFSSEVPSGGLRRRKGVAIRV